jgi:cyclic pyranopterin phosphate synthase
VRLTVDGSLHLCLGQENRLDFRSLMRSGADDADLEAALLSAIAGKPEKHDFNEQPAKLMRPMSRTGG